MWKGDNPPVLTGVIQNLKLQNWTKINTWLFPIRREKNSKSQINSFKISLLWQVRYSHIKRCGTHSSKCIRCYCVAFLHFYDLLGLNCQNISFGINSVGDKTILILSIFFKKRCLSLAMSTHLDMRDPDQWVIALHSLRGN